ncbi:MAG: beta-propeller fold lactonase family protein [Bryobacteraceae bacterium]
MRAASVVLGANAEERRVETRRRAQKCVRQVTLSFLASALWGFGPASVPPTPSPAYPSPIEIAVSANGSRLYVVCEGTDEVVEVDAAAGAVARRVRVGQHPKSVALSANGRQLYVANSWSDTVSVIDAASLKVVRELATGYEPNAAVADAEGRFLYVANRSGNDISVIDLERGVETKRLLAGRGAAYLELSADGRRVYCTHIYPLAGAFRSPNESEVTVIDTRRQVVVERERLENAAGIFHVASANGGRVAIAAEMRPKNLIPLAHVEHGWVIGNSLAVFGADIGEVVQVPIDELDRYYTPPFGLAVTPGNLQLFVSTTGSDSVTAIDLPKLLAYIRAATPEQRRLMANDLSASANYVSARIPVGRAPKGLALSPDGKRLYVANRTDDTISVIDTAAHRVTRTIGLGRAAAPTPERRGEGLFFSARFAFQGHFSCANCHIEGTIDGLAWDLEPDGFGVDIVENRLLEDIADTAPFKWNGSNPDLETECGPRTEKYFYRAQSYSPAELADIVSFVKSIPLRPNRYRRKDGELTAQQERGKAIFERGRSKNGAPIDDTNQCLGCHSGPHYTSQQLADVGTGKPTDRSPLVDVPQLTNVVLDAPYLHDGSARTLEEIWTVFNPHDRHGVTNDLSKDELNDLIEYLKTL